MDLYWWNTYSGATPSQHFCL